MNNENYEKIQSLIVDFLQDENKGFPLLQLYLIHKEQIY